MELEKILEEIEKEMTRYEAKHVKSYEKGLRYARDIIRKYLSRENTPETTRPSRDKWIPVEERMPEDGTYLCTLDGELCGIKEPFTGMCGIENGIWDEPDCVVAWRPLPEPYKPESN